MSVTVALGVVLVMDMIRLSLLGSKYFFSIAHFLSDKL